MPRLPLILILMVLVAMSLFPAQAQAIYQPGVKPGDTITYGQVSASWVSNLNPQSPFANFLNVSTIQNTITNVDQENVTFQQTKTYNNGTTNTARFYYNVQSGLGNYTTVISWLIASGLVSPEATYENPNAPTISEPFRHSMEDTTQPR